MKASPGFLIDRVFYYLLGYTMIALFMILALEIISRGIFNFSISWSYEISRMLMVTMVYIGSVKSMIDKTHIHVNCLVDKVPALRKANNLLCLVTSVIMVAAAFSFLKIIIPFNQTSATLDTPIWIKYLVILLAFFLMALSSVYSCAKEK